AKFAPGVRQDARPSLARGGQQFLLRRGRSLVLGGSITQNNPLSVRVGLIHWPLVTRAAMPECRGEACHSRARASTETQRKFIQKYLSPLLLFPRSLAPCCN